MNPHDHRQDFLELDKNRFFPPTYAEIRKLKMQRNWGWFIAVVAVTMMLLVFVSQ